MSSTRVVRIGGREFRVTLARDGAGRLFAETRGEDGECRRMEIGATRPGGIVLDGTPVEVRLTRGRGPVRTLLAGGEGWPVEVLSEAEAALSSAAPDRARSAGNVAVRAPMPGRLLAVEVEEGARVEVGAGLFIIEAMKMENEIRSPRAGVVRNLRAVAGETVEQDQELCEILAGGGTLDGASGDRRSGRAEDPQAAV